MHTSEAGQAGKRRTILRDGVECVSEAHGGASPVAAFIFMKESKTIGHIAYDGAEARCGDSLSTVIPLEPQRPECEQWIGQNGDVFPELSCESTVRGECEP